MRIVKSVIIVLLAGVPLFEECAFAQIIKFNISPVHLSKINAAHSGQQKLKRYRKFFTKDSTKQLRKLEKLSQRRWDSLARVTRKSEKLELLAQKKGVRLPLDTTAFLKQYESLLPSGLQTTRTNDKMLNSLNGEILEKSPLSRHEQTLKDAVVQDRLQIGSAENVKAEIESQLARKYGLTNDEARQYLDGDKVIKAKVNATALRMAKEQSISRLPPAQRKQLESFQTEHGQYSAEVKQYLVFLKDSVDHLDTLKTMAMSNAESMGTGLMGKEMTGTGNFKGLSDYRRQSDEMKTAQRQFTESMESLKDVSSLKAKSKEAALEKFASQSETMKALEGRMSKLKGIYSTLLNSNDLSTGIKAKSLSGRPFRERLVVGGNFNIVSTAPFMMDLSAQLGYRIDKKFQVGMGAIYRATIVDSVNISNSISPTRYGYTLFSSYGLMANFFGYAEWERTASIVRSSGDTQSTAWMSTLLVGVGRQFRVHPKVAGSILILWNPLHENGKTPYHDALVIKTGFQLTPLALMKK